MNEKKIALITGGTSGVGLSIVRSLLEQNYQVIFVGSNKGVGETLLSQLTFSKPGAAEFVCLDLSNLAQVYSFTEYFAHHYPRLDLLANIAGVVLPKREITAEGYEKTFSIGYLSSFILSTQLKPLLGRTGRIINVAAQPHSILKIKLNVEDLFFSKNYSGFTTSLATIHAKTLLIEILADQYAIEGIDVNSFHPGVVKSNLSRNLPFPYRLVSKMFTSFMAKESKTGIYVATAPEITGITGRLFNHQSPIALKFDPYDKEALWMNTHQMLQPLRFQKEEKNYKVGWISPGKIAALTHFHPVITEKDIQGVFAETQQLLEKVRVPFQIMIDNRLAPLKRLLTLEELQQSSPILLHSLLDYIVIVKPYHLELDEETSRVQVSQHIRLKNVSTVLEAIDFLKAHTKISTQEINSSFFNLSGSL